MESKSKVRENRIHEIRERKTDLIKQKEKRIIRQWDEFIPGPGEYDINYQYMIDKSPSV